MAIAHPEQLPPLSSLPTTERCVSQGPLSFCITELERGPKLKLALVDADFIAILDHVHDAPTNEKESLEEWALLEEQRPEWFRELHKLFIGRDIFFWTDDAETEWKRVEVMPLPELLPQAELLALDMSDQDDVRALLVAVFSAGFRHVALWLAGAEDVEADVVNWELSHAPAWLQELLGKVEPQEGQVVPEGEGPGDPYGGVGFDPGFELNIGPGGWLLVALLAIIALGD